jgi:hypothetical protein
VPDSVTPFHFGWKLAEIVLVDGHLRLRSGTVGVLVDIDEAACCLKHPEHDAPERRCTCGLCARIASESLVLYARYPFSHLLEVELTGRVLTGRGELRAQHQRVLRVLLLPTCYGCSAVATLLGEPPPSPQRIDLFPAPALTGTCERCAGARWWLPEEVEEELGVPVSWALPAEALVLHGAGMNFGDH